MSSSQPGPDSPSSPGSSRSTPRDDCDLFSLTQYQCQPTGTKITCWPLERIFRQCGKDKPAVEVTNAMITAQDGKRVVDPAFLDNPPRGRNWADVR